MKYLKIKFCYRSLVRRNYCKFYLTPIFVGWHQNFQFTACKYGVIFIIFMYQSESAFTVACVSVRRCLCAAGAQTSTHNLPESRWRTRNPQIIQNFQINKTNLITLLIMAKLLISVETALSERQPPSFQIMQLLKLM